MNYHLISIVIPVYNQADHIRQSVEEYIAALAHLPYQQEYLLVVNGSSDRSLEACHELMNGKKGVRVLYSQRAGWGLAVKYGLREAKGDLLCYTNGARTSPQDLTLILLYALANPGTVVKANRKLRENWKRRLGSLLYNIECRNLFDLAYWDINGTPKAFPRSCSELLHLTCENDLIDLEFHTICRWEHYSILEVPIFSTRRHGGASTTNYRSAFRMYWGAYKAWREKRL